MANLRNDSALWSKLYISCISRGGDLNEFFKHENQDSPPSLSLNGIPLPCEKKADLLKCLPFPPDMPVVAPCVEAKIFDGPVLVHILAPGASKTFQEYADSVFLPYLESQLQNCKRVDVVWDEYVPLSLKKNTRTKRGTGDRVLVKAAGPIPRNWRQFLRLEDNKAELFKFLASCISKMQVPEHKEVITTLGSLALASTARQDISGISPCDHEEADTRLILHAKDCVRQGRETVMIRTVDTDVVVIATSAVQEISCKELWIAFGTGKDFKYLDIKALAANLGHRKSMALPIFHAFTGCDQVSKFNNRGKKSAWDTWEVMPDANEAFIALGSGDYEASFPDIEKFTVLLYHRSSTVTSVDQARRVLVCKKKRAMDNIPPTSDALKLHAKRAAYVGGKVWWKSTRPVMDVECPSSHGWVREGDTWLVVWRSLPMSSEACKELLRCGCMKGCVPSRCNCLRSNQICTAMCECDGACGEEFDSECEDS